MQPSTLLFLPLAHVFARIIQVACLKARIRLGHTADIKNLLDDLAEFQPTFILAIPRVFEKVFNTASQRAVADGRGKIFGRAAEVAIAWSRALGVGEARACGVRAQHRVFDRLVYAKLRAALGDQLRVRRVRRRPPRGTARPLLPRHRRQRARGLRAHRDHRSDHGQPPACPEGGHGRSPAAGHQRTGRRRRRAAVPRAARSSPATGETTRRPQRPRTPTAGCAPATSARSTTRGSCGSPAGRRRSW